METDLFAPAQLLPAASLAPGPAFTFPAIPLGGAAFGGGDGGAGSPSPPSPSSRPRARAPTPSPPLCLSR